MSLVHFLARVPLFSAFPLDELERTLASVDKVRLKAGDFLFYEGDTGEHLFVVIDGKLDIVIGFGTTSESIVNTLGGGESLGEFSIFITGGKRTASARARTDIELLRMHRDHFIQLLHRSPESALVTYLDLAITNRRLQQITIEKELLEQELKIAADIQKSILPDKLPLHEKFDFGARMLPARQVGGDFYDIFYVDHNRIGVLIGDVADKGIPSAIFMARVHALITAEAESSTSAGDVLRKVNKHITQLDKSTQFVTALYGILDAETGEFSYARAGHEPPIYLNSQGEIRRLPYKAGMALGLREQITLDQASIFLSRGSLLIMFTDGLTDCRNPKGDNFGLERIRNTLADLKNNSAQAVCDQLLDTLMVYQSGSKQDDDVTLVAVHAK
jgi:serine phosphatase RsbU (regulator of sigma subunit)